MSPMQWLFVEGPLYDVNEVIVFGTGSTGLYVKDFLQKQGIQIICFFDNDPNKLKKAIDNIPIQAPSFELQYENTPVVIASAWFAEIHAQLVRLGFKRFYCGLQEYSGPYPKNEDVDRNLIEQNDYNVVLILPAHACDCAYLLRGLHWYKQRFAKAKTQHIASLAKLVDEFKNLLGEQITIYEKKLMIQKYDV